ncbi:hypothetical protein CQ064_09625 [Bacillus sp. MYb78]|nr:hypothetical protein bthur0002_60580 [Bacillus thuringiensis Bt407]PQZ78305.1 hypothetical protein CQ064_09625 [Bacillus sp. MYb78]
MVVIGMGEGLWTSEDLLSSEQLTLHQMYQQLNNDEQAVVKNEYPEFIAYLITTNQIERKRYLVEKGNESWKH